MPLWIYNLGIRLYGLAAKILAIFKPKAKLFVQGRKKIFSRLKESLALEHRPRIWIHAASLGEFELARPFIEKLRAEYPQYAVLLSFFSPSGYMIRKDYPGVDYVFYLPLDTANNARRWFDIVAPQAVFFAKYEYWYHYLHQAYQRGIPAFIFSATFRPEQIFFRRSGTLHRKMLGFLKHIFVQDQISKELLDSIGIFHSSVCGDTRIDRALEIKNNLKSFPLIESFKGLKKLIIGGSVWAPDWKMLLDAFVHLPNEYKLLLAPHEINEHTLQAIEQHAKGLGLKCCRYSNYNESIPHAQEYPIFILDTIGMLAQVYQYADIAWVGGGFGTKGLHNILEPAVFEIPIFFGPNHKKFPEAQRLIDMQIAFEVRQPQFFVEQIQNPDLYTLSRQGAHTYFEQNQGAVRRMMDYLRLEKCLSTKA